MDEPNRALPLLRMSGIRKTFAATRALDGVDLEVAAGSVHALLGENGAGKSTLMKVLSGALTPDEGSIWIAGQPYRPRDPRDGRGAGVAMIYQELSLAPHLSIMENILLGVEPQRGPFVDWSELRQRAGAALQRVGRPDLCPDTRVADLGPADQQLVELARGIAVGCRILVLDEPTSSIAADDVERLFRLVEQLRASGMAIIYISHFLEEVQRLCDRFTILRDGRTVASGQPGAWTHEQFAQAMVGRAVEQLYPRSARSPGETLLRVDHLRGSRLPLEASLELRRGEVVGIAGLVGSGRTELLRAIFGLDPVHAGTVRIGSLASAPSPRTLWQGAAGMVSEDRKREGLAPRLSIADNLTLPQLRGLGPCNLVLPGRQRQAAARWIDRFSIRCGGPGQRIESLSGGNQQKAAIARLLHADVDVLLLDEPTRGIDVGSKAEIYRWIDQLVSNDPAKAVLIVSSYLPELLGVCDRIAVMSRGRLGEARPARDRNEHEMMMEALGTGTTA